MTLDFGLIEYGQTIEKIVEIKNLSPIIAKCQIEEIAQVEAHLRGGLSIRSLCRNNRILSSSYPMELTSP